MLASSEQLKSWLLTVGHCSAGRITVHAPGSLEDIVSNLVKNWEKEVSYKTHEEDFRTIDLE